MITTPSPEKHEKHNYISPAISTEVVPSETLPNSHLAPEDKSSGQNGKPLTLSKQRKSLTRSNSIRSKGIGLNLAVSPVNAGIGSSAVHQRSVSNSSNVSSLAQVTEYGHDSQSPASYESHNRGSEDLKYDVPLPPSSEIASLGLEDQLRLLALKEMSVVEIKDSITSLQQKLNNHEKELHKLRELIQSLLYNELQINEKADQPQRRRQNSNPREEAIANSRKNRKSAYIDDKSSLWSNLSKPLSLIQQFDTMLQNEFEKSLINHAPTKQTSQSQPVTNQQLHSTLHKHRSRLSEDSSSSTSSMPSPLKSKSTKSDPINLDELIQEEDHPEDMIHTVSNSIWSFMNEVKTNVLSSMNEPEYGLKSDTVYNLDNGSNVSLGDTTIMAEDFDRILDTKHKKD